MLKSEAHVTLKFEPPLTGFQSCWTASTAAIRAHPGYIRLPVIDPRLTIRVGRLHLRLQCLRIFADLQETLT